ncbi:MAG: sodium:solute symporter [Bacteroidales bacterium]|nr:sodium:solute symporter [Bacteroidales bacterium]
MTATIILTVIIIYFSILLIIAYFTSKNNDNNSFFLANKQSPWFVVAFGMIGASLSGVTFISVPGWVDASQFSYMQMILGYLAGYIVVAFVLLPLYYRLNLISIYSYLDQRFGTVTYKTGASFFLLSRVIGASFRLFLVAGVLQYLVFDQWGIPFYVSVSITILLIWVYTFKGGINTIVWTDTLQTFFMLTAVGATFWLLSREMNWSIGDAIREIKQSTYSQIWFFDDFKDAKFFVKQFLAGAFITIVMTGLDQDMMQKNLTCRNTKEAQKNMLWFSLTLVPVNLLFLSLGALLYLFAQQHGIQIPSRVDYLYPEIAVNGSLPIAVGIFFIVGLIASAYSSADSALTALTTSFSLDIIGIDKKYEAQQQIKVRKLIHIGFSVLIAMVIIIFEWISNDSVIKLLFDAAGYTYGPLLGLYAFGLFTKLKINDRISVWILLAAPILTFIIKYLTIHFNTSYQIGFELLIINGLISFLGLWAISNKGDLK